jgi:hypothetical protein
MNGLIEAQKKQILELSRKVLSSPTQAAPLKVSNRLKMGTRQVANPPQGQGRK